MKQEPETSILTMADDVITRNPRVTLTRNPTSVWRLHVEEIREEDRGWYMCQVNTDPASSQSAYLNVVGQSRSLALDPISSVHLPLEQYCGIISILII